jgi:diaminopimelate decarboxylase
LEISLQIFGHKGEHYYADNVPVHRIVESCDTPFYCYSRLAIESAFDAYATAFSQHDTLICYAVKANSSQAVLRILAARGAGADVVSEGELRRALLAGMPASKIVYSGVAKTAPEIEFALSNDILQFNVESEPELHQISAVAARLGKTARIAFRINPDIDAGTHEKMSTGKSVNKFGIPWQMAQQAYADAAALPGIEVCGIDIHIGSQILSLDPYSQAFERIAKLVTQLREDGHVISTIDLGGGLGISYDPDNDVAPATEQYAELALTTFGHLDCRLILEPGRSIVGNAGILVSSVIYVKQGGSSTFLIIDAAMNDFLRPSMYDAYHNIVGERNDGTEQVLYDIVGPVCETGDTFARARPLTVQQAGDLIFIEGAGAYGSVMASGYNTRPLVPEVLVENDEFRIIRARPDYDSIIGLDLP